MAIHESLNPARRTGSASDSKGRWVPVGGRTGASYTWDVTVDVGDVESGGTVTVRLEGALRRSDDDAATLYTFPARTTVGQDTVTVTLSGHLRRGFVRTVANINGTVTIGSLEEAAFFNVTAESGRLREQLSKWSEVGEAAKEAERELLSPFRSAHGYDLLIHKHGWTEAVRNAVARQLERRFTLWALGKAADPTSAVTLRETEPVDRMARREISLFSANRGGF